MLHTNFELLSTADFICNKLNRIAVKNKVLAFLEKYFIPVNLLVGVKIIFKLQIRYLDINA